MSRLAWLYIWMVLLTGIAITGWMLPIPTLSVSQWLTFLVLILLTATSELYKVFVGRQSYFPHTGLFFASLLLLPVQLFAGIVLVPHLVEWRKKRRNDNFSLCNWYVQPFNIATHIIAGYAAFGLLTLLDTETPLYLTPQNTLLICGAAVLYILINHLLVGQVLVLVHGIPWQQSKILAVGLISIEVLTVLSGYGVALVWLLAPWLMPLMFILVLWAYHQLLAPRLQQYA